MIEWCENGIVSMVSPRNHGGIDAELACAERIVGALRTLNAAADFGSWPQGERILRELARGTRPCGANAPDPLIDRATV